MDRFVLLLFSFFHLALVLNNLSVKFAGSSINTRIVGGWDTPRRYFPHHVALVHKVRVDNFEVWKYKCGGTLIHEIWVVTAAHCFYEKGQRIQNSKLAVALEQELNTYKDQWLRSDIFTQVNAVVMYPDYSVNVSEYGTDVGLLRLATAANYSFYLQPAELPPYGTIPAPSSQFCIAGWGKTNITHPFTGENKKQLQATCLVVLDHEKCLQSENPVLQRGGHFCASVPGKPIGVCWGDTGSGAVIKPEHGRFVIIGLVSIIPSSCHGQNDNDPIIFTSLGFITPWINRLVNASFG